MFSIQKPKTQKPSRSQIRAQGLITEVGLLRSWSQEAAVRFILQNEFNQWPVRRCLERKKHLQKSERRCVKK